MEHLGQYSILVIAIIVSIFCLGAGVFISFLFRPMNPTQIKLSTYECGEPTIGSSRVNFRNMFYLFALAFVIFDIEVVFLLPVALAFRKLGLFAFIEILLFVVMLFLALIYAWRKGALRWE